MNYCRWIITRLPLVVLVFGMGCKSTRSLRVVSFADMKPVSGALYRPKNVNLLRISNCSAPPLKAGLNGELQINSSISADVICRGFFATLYRGGGGTVYLFPTPLEGPRINKAFRKATNLFWTAGLRDQIPQRDLGFRFFPEGGNHLFSEWNKIAEEIP